jgi:hypothetical protein
MIEVARLGNQAKEPAMDAIVLIADVDVHGRGKVRPFSAFPPPVSRWQRIALLLGEAAAETLFFPESVP